MLKIYTVFDQVAAAYLKPFTLPSDALAIRAFTDAVNTPDHPFNKHPADYTLFYVGEFDETTAIITPETAHALGNGLSYLWPEVFANPEMDIPHGP